MQGSGSSKIGALNVTLEFVASFKYIMRSYFYEIFILEGLYEKI